MKASKTSKKIVLNKRITNYFQAVDKLNDKDGQTISSLLKDKEARMDTMVRI